MPDMTTVHHQDNLTLELITLYNYYNVLGICDPKVLGSRLSTIAITESGWERTRGQHTTHAHEPSGQQQRSSQHETIAPSDQATHYTTGYNTSLLAHGALGKESCGSPPSAGLHRTVHVHVLDLDVLGEGHSVLRTSLRLFTRRFLAARKSYTLPPSQLF